MDQNYATKRLFAAIEADSPFDVFRVVKEGVDPNTVFDQGLSTVQYAIVKQRLHVLKVLLELGADIDCVGSNSRSAAYLALQAASAGQPELFEKVLQAGARLDCRDERGQTLLHLAAAIGRVGIVRELLARGLDANARDDTGRAPLHGLYHSGCADTALALLAGGANIDAEDSHGCRPLHVSVARSHKRSVQILVALGASTWAVMSTLNDVEALLRTDRLACATLSESPALVHHVLEHCANLKAEDVAGAMSLALRHADSTILDMLRSWGAQQAARQSLEAAAHPGCTQAVPQR